MKKLKKAALMLAAAALIVLNLCPVFAQEIDPDVYSSGYCVMNTNTGEIIFQKNMDEKKYPASITKIMTAIVALENCSDLSETLTFSDQAVNSLTSNSSTLTPKASVGEEMTVEEALYGMMLCSANECANALAEYTSGSVEQFAALMNQKAEEIGAVNTHFVNAHGLHDDNHYTTPHDMALIFQYALKNPVFAEIVSTVKYTIPKTNKNDARDCYMTHQLVNGAIDFEGVYAGKTGHTAEAGRTLVTAAKRYGVDLIAVVMGSDDAHFCTDTEILFEYAFGLVTGSYPNVVYTPMDDTVVTAQDLRVREFPSIYAAQVESALTGTVLHRVGTYAGWSRVETSGGTYYVSTDFLLNQEGAPVAEPYETLAPTEAESAEEPSSEEETTEAAPESEAETESVRETEAAAAIGQIPQPSQNVSSQLQQYYGGSQHTYEVNEEILMLAILILIVLIAVDAGMIVAVLIMRKAAAPAEES